MENGPNYPKKVSETFTEAFHMKSNIVLSLLAILFVLAGCMQPTPVVQPTLMATQTQVHLSPTPRVTPLPTKTLVSTSLPFGIREYCPEISMDTEFIPSLKGTIVLTGEDFSFQGQDYTTQEAQSSIVLFWDSAKDEAKTYLLPDENVFFYFVTSPDKLHLALTQAKTLAMDTEVIVLSSVGAEEAKFPLQGDWGLVDWINNEQLAVRQFRLATPSLPNSAFDLVIADPLTGEQHSLPSDFPDFETEATYWLGSSVVYDPTITSAVYLTSTGNGYSIVWDLRDKRRIAKISEGSWPEWSPDGVSLLVIGKGSVSKPDIDEIFIYRQGQVTRSSFFEDHLEKAIINLPSWSPDGRYIAFWLSVASPIKSARLAVLDTKTSKVDLYCMEVDPFPVRFGDYLNLGSSYFQVNAAPPIWSPDGRYLLIEDRIISAGVDDTYLVDLQHHSITQLAKNARPVSWMK